MKNKTLKNTELYMIIPAILALGVMLSGCVEEVKKENTIEQKNPDASSIAPAGSEIKEAAPQSNPGTQALLFQEAKINEFNNNSVSASFRIDGMTCGGCVATIESALSNVPGVKKYNVYLGSPGKAVVEYEPSAVTTGEIAAAITKSRYPAALISSDEASGINVTTTETAGSCGGSTCGAKTAGGCGCSK